MDEKDEIMFQLILAFQDEEEDIIDEHHEDLKIENEWDTYDEVCLERMDYESY